MHKGKNTLVLDLDETLIHSSFTEVEADILLNIEVNNQKFKVFVLKRPGVEEFLEKCYELFEVVVFTASLSSYADPLLDLLDPKKKISFRLFRESCSFNNGFYVKDLTRLGRDLKNVVIVDVRKN
jgi:RNA polymerase II subunit A small phosphatase-like protein